MPKNVCVLMEKDGKQRKFCWSVDKAEALANGWKPVGEQKPAPAPAPAKLPELAVVAGADAFEMDGKFEEPSESLDEMTKNELLDWALDRGHDLKNALPKREILEACKQIEAEG